LTVANLHPDLIFYPDQIRQPTPTLVNIAVLNEQRALPVLAFRNQRVIGVQLLLNTSGFKNLLDSKHFLNLVFYGGLIFKDQLDVLADQYPTIFFVG